MQVVKYNSANKIAILSLVQDVFNRGGTVVYPTETSYGLGGDLFSEMAYRKVLAIKGRPKDKALPVLIAGINQASSLVKFSATARQLAEQYWPGPLTLVLPYNVRPDNQWLPIDSLALRISSHPLAYEMAKIAARPIISTSANIAGMGSVYSIAELLKQLAERGSKPDLIIDAGSLPTVPASTIVKVIDDKIEIIRQGKIKI